jgi:transglutaminase-like putative cysteine protease
MERSVAFTGASLLLIGLGIFFWKVWVYDLPVVPGEPEGLWRVELSIAVRGSGGRGSVRAPLPSSGPGQIVYDERSVADRLRFTVRDERDQRVAVWQGRLEGIHDLSHAFRVQLFEVSITVPERSTTPPAEVVEEFAGASPDFPSDAPEIRRRLKSLSLPPPDDAAGRIRTVFALVSHEIATSDGASDDALITLANREGSPRGKTALLVAMLRGAGIPARPVVGLELRPGGPVREFTWTEAWVDDEWIPMSSTEGFFATRPRTLLALHTGSFADVEATGAEAVSYRYDALRERLRADELAAMMVPPNPVLAEISLFRLPVATQAALRALLVLPLGALLVALLRNLVGMPTYGTFLPILVAFALRETPLAVGLAMVVGVIGVGVLGRIVLDRLHLLLVPRLSIMLCFVVLAVTAYAIVGRGTENRNLFAGVLFPIVILTMLVERFSIAMAESGMREALVQGGSTLLVIAAVYPVLRSSLAAHLMFGFPELVIALMGLLVLIGGYTGYRVMDLIRFRSFAFLRREGA